MLLAVSGARGVLIENFTSGGSVGMIPDGNPDGAAFLGTVSEAPGMTVGELTVTLNISGGYNGNLYAYLDAPNGTQVVLMNQPGVSGEIHLEPPARDEHHAARRHRRQRFHPERNERSGVERVV